MQFRLALRVLPVFLAVGLCLGAGSAEVANPFAPKKIARPERISMSAIWDVAGHASSPDLLWFKDRWIVVFREASSAESADGAIRVMTSLDGVKWSPWARLDHPVADLGKPLLHTMPDGRLLLTVAVTMHADGPDRHRTYAWKSWEGRAWQGPEMVGDGGTVFGPIAWMRGKAYTFGLQPGMDGGGLRSYEADYDLDLRPFGPALVIADRLASPSIAFLPNDIGIAVAEHADGTLWWGQTTPPYRFWDWKSLGQKVSDPRLVRLEDGRLLVSGADAKGRASLFWLNPAEATLTQAGALSAAATSEGAGIRWHDGAVWAVYQAPSTNGNLGIYIAQIKLP